MTVKKDIFILIAEDDADDRFLLQAAFEENGFTDRLHFVENGVEALDYLQSLCNNANEPVLPKFMLLDLNMPKKDGREVLKELKQHPELKKIPVPVNACDRSFQLSLSPPPCFLAAEA